MSNKVTFQVLQTSDLHGYIYPFSYTSKLEEPIGLAKISSIVKKLRTPNTILIDSGDTIQGSPITFYQSKKCVDKVNPMAKIFNYMRYDYVTIGNHDFNYGKEYLNNYITNLDSTILNCNLLNMKSKSPFTGISYDIKKIDGVKIGIIGVTTHYITNWENSENIKGIEILDAFTQTKKTVELIRDKVDFLIVNYHGGFERDLETNELLTLDTSENQGSKMINEIKGIDLLLTGHQHRSLKGIRNNTIYTQPGFNGQSLSKVVIEYDKNSLSYDLIENCIVTLDTVKADNEVLRLVQETEDQTQEFLDTPVGHLDKDMLIIDQFEARINKHPLISLINHIQLQYSKADISLCGLGNSVSGFRKEITIRDVIGTYIYPNTLVVKELSGHVLKQALEKTAEFFDIEDNEFTISDQFKYPKLQLYAYDMYDGIEYTINVSKPVGSRITTLTKDGQQLDLDKNYSVAMNSYRSTGGGDYFFIKNSKTIIDTQKEVIDLLLEYILDKNHIVISHTENIKVIK